jgi:hypothetical protein
MPHEPDPGELSHLLHGFAAFLQEHRWCGELDGGADDDYLCMTCHAARSATGRWSLLALT